MATSRGAQPPGQARGQDPGSPYLHQRAPGEFHPSPSLRLQHHPWFSLQLEQLGELEIQGSKCCSHGLGGCLVTCCHVAKRPELNGLKQPPCYYHLLLRVDWAQRGESSALCDVSESGHHPGLPWAGELPRGSCINPVFLWGHWEGWAHLGHRGDWASLSVPPESQCLSLSR